MVRTVAALGCGAESRRATTCPGALCRDRGLPPRAQWGRIPAAGAAATGIELEILAHEQEAGLAAAGCLPYRVGRPVPPSWLTSAAGVPRSCGWTAARPAIAARQPVPAGRRGGLSEAFTSEPDESTFEAMVRESAL